MFDQLVLWVILALGALLVLLLIRSIIRAYAKTPANLAFVRTGGLFRKPGDPPKVVMNGGAWVFRTIHEITWVDLGTMAIEIERTEDNALLTIDPQYADIKAIFYIKVSPTTNGIIDAARTIGGKYIDADTVKKLVDSKLDGALRDVAATFTLMSLHQEREHFIQEVQSRVKNDLEENGLVLESVSILTLRAARQGSFATDDVFGAQVARANAEVIQKAIRERNDIERQTEIEIKKRDTDTARLALDLDRELALATASQEREVRSQRATEKAVADQKEYEESQKAEMARVAKERAVAVAELERDQQLAVQDELKQQEIMEAEQARMKMQERVELQRQIAVLQAEQEREQAEKSRLDVAAEREEAAQRVMTVEATQQAEREMHIQVIESERDAKREMIQQKNEIELEALRKQREAEAEAIALKEIANAEAIAALKKAETVRTQAEADTEAEKMRADAARAKSSAEGLAEAEVMEAKATAGLREAEAVRAGGLAEAERDKAKAEALAAYDGVAQRVEIIRLQLDAQVRIEVARSEALGGALAAMDVKMIGDPASAAALLRMVTMADGMGEVLEATPQPLREMGRQIIDKVISNGSGDDTVNGQATGIAELALLIPKIISIVDKTLKVNRLKKGITVGEVLQRLVKRVEDEGDRVVLEKAQQALAMLPILNEMPFEDVYLRATVK